MFYSLKDMFEMQRHSEHAGASILGIFPSDMGEYFATAKHILNEAGHERGRFCGKEIPDCSIHLVDENTQFSDHSMWPGRIFITLFGQNNVAVDDVGLATIVSHLLAHSYLNHRGEVMSFGHFEEIARYPTPVLALLAIASKQIRIPAVLYCLCVGALYVCGQEMYSKMLEREADIWGLELMRIAGYDVTKATQYWERKMGYDLQVIHSANVERAIEGTDAGTKKFLGDLIESYRQDVKMNKIHIATIQRYIKDKGILPFLVEEPRTTEDPPKPTETKDESDSDVPESKN
ncbi:hypothetical protein EYC84_002289 [Monilinia fructicola]|uniref:Peptidase M48 domain-containing protein n=1 Tax=Monilinia fructicola TaxID=38448 RepID=A0A5M9JKY5_MONFR|nr:hypothetical protein EYC84_002289 [Monilinia fructicola]